MTDHTPGPWIYESGMVYAIGNKWTDGEPNLVPIARMDREAGNGTSPAERDRNARLCAAATDMLDVCQNGVADVQQVLDGWANGDMFGAVNGLEAWQESARDAIAKATNP